MQSSLRMSVLGIILSVRESLSILSYESVPAGLDRPENCHHERRAWREEICFPRRKQIPPRAEALVVMTIDTPSALHSRAASMVGRSALLAKTRPNPQ